jgi:hypothetical protein
MSKKVIIGVNVSNRMKKAKDVQKLLTEYGCNIKTRIGLHDVSGDFCSPTGLLVMEMFGAEKTIKEFEGKLKAIEGLEVKKMTFIV